MSPNDHLRLMIDVARGARAWTLAYRARIDDIEVPFRSQADLLCETNEAVEALTFDQLRAAHPEIAFRCEEGGARGPSDATLCRVVAAIDGTTNFLSGLSFMISIVLVSGKTTLAGMIHACSKTRCSALRLAQASP